jgi:plasmid stabilization system protein ParE
VKRPVYVLSEAALSDIHALASFVFEQSPDGALKLLDAIESGFMFVAASPGAGRPCPEWGTTGLRLWAVYSYLILYRSDTKPVEVVRVLHGARDVAAVMRGKR